MADMKAMMRESAKAKREMEEMRRKAEADLDEILDECCAASGFARKGAMLMSRGVQIHTLEVTAYRCQDDSTARILEQIIQETTNRINRKMKQKSDNEVAHEVLTARARGYPPASPAARTAQRQPCGSRLRSTGLPSSSDHSGCAAREATVSAPRSWEPARAGRALSGDATRCVQPSSCEEEERREED